MWESTRVELDEIPKIIEKLEIMKKLKSFSIDTRYVFTLQEDELIYLMSGPDLLTIVQQAPNLQFSSFFISQRVK